MRGVSFEIPNEYGKQLFDIFKDIDITQWHWRIGGGESYIIEDGTLGKDLFDPVQVLTGEALYKFISEHDYYLIFTDLKAFDHAEDVMEIETYEDFVKSDCQLVLLVVDSSYVTVYAKDPSVIQDLYQRAIAVHYENIHYITHKDDPRTRLIAF